MGFYRGYITSPISPKLSPDAKFDLVNSVHVHVISVLMRGLLVNFGLERRRYLPDL